MVSSIKSTKDTMYSCIYVISEQICSILAQTMTMTSSSFLLVLMIFVIVYNQIFIVNWIDPVSCQFLYLLMYSIFEVHGN